MKYITATGGEELPEDVPRDKAIVERSIPIEKGLKDCLIAWEMNGEPIPLSHGGPVRFVVPGYFGCNQTKYVKAIAATVEQSTAKSNPVATVSDPSERKGTISNHRCGVCSLKVGLSMPRRCLTADIESKVAFSGERGVSKVEYSLDGEHWQDAEFYGPDLGVHAWRVFQAMVEIPDGQSIVYTRAIDTQGDIQPKNRVENERGYGNNSWLDHRFNIRNNGMIVEDDAVVTDISQETVAAGKQVYQESVPSCGTCHTLDDAGSLGQVGPNLNELQPDATRVERAVTNGVGAMPAFGESLTPEQIKDLAAYVADAARK